MQNEHFSQSHIKIFVVLHFYIFGFGDDDSSDHFIMDESPEAKQNTPSA